VIDSFLTGARPAVSKRAESLARLATEREPVELARVEVVRSGGTTEFVLAPDELAAFEEELLKTDEPSTPQRIMRWQVSRAKCGGLD